jgi:leader peptidase (prepilin peptidase)/N-methyltransferase
MSVAAPVLVAVCAVAGGTVGLAVRPVVDRVTAERSAGRPPTGRSRLLAPATAAVCGATAWSLGWTWSLPAYLALAAFLAALTFIDLDTKTLPRRIVWAAGLTGVALLAGASLAAGEPHRIFLATAGAAVAFALLCALHILAPAGLGFGDVRLGAVLGWYLGWQSLSLMLTGLAAAFVVSAVVGVVLMACGRAGRRTEVPFGPALAIGALLVLLLAAPAGPGPLF